MKRLFVLFFAAIVLFSCIVTSNCAFASATEDQWAAMADMPTPRGYLRVATVNEKIYAIGGSGPIGTNEEYDPTTNIWTTKASMPNPQQSFAIAVYDNKIYCIGGLSTDVSTDNKVYNPANNSWETKTPMPTARFGLQANVVNGKIYCTGGVRLLGYNQGAEELTITEVYDPSTDTWATKSPMPNPAGYVSAVVDDKIYVIGPQLTQVYDPAADSWSTAAPPHVNITAGGANGIAAEAASTTGAMAPKRIYVYDKTILQIFNPKNNSWTKGTPPPTSRQYLGIANVNDKLYFIGGFTFSPLWIYTDYANNDQYTPTDYGNPTEPEPWSPQGIMNSLATNPAVIVIVVLSLSVAISVLIFLIYHRKHNASQRSG
jgi:N-acetylneuraminic acid mutarotase